MSQRGGKGQPIPRGDARFWLCPALALACVAIATAPGAAQSVIAHRGASGYLPEHTLAAYAVAHAQGADFIEPDLVMTRDGVLIARHDVHLEGTTDVERVFPGRARADGHWYAADFDFPEIRRLRAQERRAGRFRRESRGFGVPRLEEVLELVADLNRLTGCGVGVYPELKRPALHAERGLPMEAALLEVLARFGYRGGDAPVRIQSFEPGSLKKLRRELGTELPLVQLVSGDPDHDALVTEAGLDEVATYADGIAPDKRRIEGEGGLPVASLVSDARARGLFVDAWTFRRDEIPTWHGSFEGEVRRFLYDYGVDGIFTDHPDAALAALGPRGLLDRLRGRQARPPGCRRLVSGRSSE